MGKHLSVKCSQCCRDIDPNWVRNLRAVVAASVDATFRAMQADHRVEFPPNWRSSFTKRLTGLLVQKIWEIERGLSFVRHRLEECDSNEEEK